MPIEENDPPRTDTPGLPPAVGGNSARVLTADVIRENQDWVRGLSATGDTQERASRHLYSLLLRAAQAEARRVASRLQLAGPEADDLAHQAAADALLTITSKVEAFRGESKFTTWAYKFVIFAVAGKVNRHFWQRAGMALDDGDWDAFPARGGGPEDWVEARDLANAVRHAVDEALTARQRAVFVALVLDETPMNVLASRLDSTHNAIYKTMFDARKKLRSTLVRGGYLPEQQRTRDDIEHAQLQPLTAS
ncbi:sigma-70 family RNA polymerase sigma factor [Jiangella asiatica]|uniref:Sigma-70 family RNA polymerase sigma factor n=1 Tax=Jiangella asiatica TaxID=2530372 RepID=A0A4V2Z3V5_9ACTN|nr:sigma-70 family RNA polymerase sigma factor [Jiangella asiatica]TDE14218.1 sigma-70 family RNA polymerase sigma factor [Jiangella asiatica]